MYHKAASRSNADHYHVSRFTAQCVLSRCLNSACHMQSSKQTNMQFSTYTQGRNKGKEILKCNSFVVILITSYKWLCFVFVCLLFPYSQCSILQRATFPSRFPFPSIRQVNLDPAETQRNPHLARASKPGVNKTAVLCLRSAGHLRPPVLSKVMH